MFGRGKHLEIPQLDGASARVVFPQPDSPKSPTMEPGSTWNGTSETTGTVMFRTESRSTVRFRTANAPDGIPPILAQSGAGRNQDK